MKRFFPGKGTYGEPKFVGKVGCCYTGNYCSFASDVRIITVGHNIDRVTTYPFDARELFISRNFGPAPETEKEHPLEYGDVRIGHDVWVGYNVTIIGGVTIGNGAVLAAGAVIRNDVPDYAVVYGNPMRISHFRFDRETIKCLNEIRWWNWGATKIKSHLRDLLSIDVRKFVTKFMKEVSNGDKDSA